MKNYQDFKIKTIAKEDINYPESFGKLSDAPKLISYRGELSNDLLKNTIAIVGPRRMSRYAQDVVSTFVAAFVSAGVTVISGFMYGVDTEAHTQALHFGGKTIAVLGSGINQCYPPENKKLYTKILMQGGAVLSEYKPEAKSKPWMFAKRNRLIAALSTLGVLVVEAAQNSGTLITASYALKLHTPLFAIPGPITSANAHGVNSLIKSGKAKMVTTPADILGNDSGVDAVGANSLSSENNSILSLLKIEPLSADEISMNLDRDVTEVLSAMSELLIEGKVVEVGGRYQAT